MDLPRSRCCSPRALTRDATVTATRRDSPTSVSCPRCTTPVDTGVTWSPSRRSRVSIKAATRSLPSSARDRNASRTQNDPGCRDSMSTVLAANWIWWLLLPLTALVLVYLAAGQTLWTALGFGLLALYSYLSLI